MKEIDPKDLMDHTNAESCWIVIDDHVFDLTSFLSKHPGGSIILLKYAGKDATDVFNEIPGHIDALRTLDEMCIGKLSHSI